jgi:hypothetical protein
MIAYLLAGTATPRLGEAPPTTPEAFVESCRGFVTAVQLRDLAEAAGAPVPPDGDAFTTQRPHAAAEAWSDLEAQVDDAVVRRRSELVRGDPRPHLRPAKGFRVDVLAGVAAAFARPHPGDRERALDELRWRLASELAVADPDAFGALLARAVHLRLAWRWARWDADAGWAALESALLQIEASVDADATPAAPAGARSEARRA